MAIKLNIGLEFNRVFAVNCYCRDIGAPETVEVAF